jgi:hypothetical protein
MPKTLQKRNPVKPSYMPEGDENPENEEAYRESRIQVILHDLTQSIDGLDQAISVLANRLAVVITPNSSPESDGDVDRHNANISTLANILLARRLQVDDIRRRVEDLLDSVEL